MSKTGRKAVVKKWNKIADSIGLKRESICLATGCKRKRVARGLCQSCYVAMRLEVKSGQQTWTELERLGLALPAKKAGRPKTAAIHKALKKKTSKRATGKQSAK